MGFLFCCIDQSVLAAILCNQENVSNVNNK
jgi:hypothetical protein